MFAVCLGFGATGPLPYHSGKVTRIGSDFHQYFFRRGSFEILWVEFVPLDARGVDRAMGQNGVNGAYDRHHMFPHGRNKRQMKNRRDIAVQLITQLTNVERTELAQPPPRREKRRPEDA